MLIATLTTLTILVVVAIVLIKKHLTKKKEAAAKLLEDLVNLRREGPESALRALEGIKTNQINVKSAARQCISAMCVDLAADNPTTLTAALNASTRFDKQMEIIRHHCRVHGLNFQKVIPEPEAKLKQDFLAQQVAILKTSLQHFPEIGRKDFAPEKIFEALLQCAKPSESTAEIETWKGWRRNANMRMAKAELKRLKRNNFWDPTQAAASIDLIKRYLKDAEGNYQDLDLVDEAALDFLKNCCDHGIAK